MRHWIKVPLYTLLIGAACGCGGSQASRVQQAKVDEVAENSDDQIDTIDDRRDERNDAIEERADAREDIADGSLDGASEDRAEIVIETERDRDLYASNAKSELDKQAVRVNEAERKLEMKDKNTVKLGQQVQAARAQIEMLRDDVSKLSTAGAEKWEAMTERIDDRFEDLEAIVDALQERADS